MRCLLASTILVLSTILPSASFAQSAAGQTAAGEGIEKVRGSLSTSFDDLPLVLKIGKKIMVRDENGRSSEGSVVSISDKQLVISRQGFFLRRMEYTFARDVVRRIDLVDSTWDGGGIGAAAGLGLWVAVARLGASDHNDFLLAVAYLGPLAALAGAATGTLIDRLNNTTIYEQGTRVSLTPMLRRNAVGVVARVDF
jgi:hypothetical protein